MKTTSIRFSLASAFSLLLLLGFSPIGLPPVGALEPVVIAGADAGFTTTVTASGQTVTGRTVPRLSVTWRERLDGGGFVSLEGRASTSVPFDAPSEITDQESLGGELGVDVGEDELLLGLSLDTSFAQRGVARTLLVPSWSADYHFVTDTGSLALQSDGRYRFNTDALDDHLVQRLGLAYSHSESIRLAVTSAFFGGYEYWVDVDRQDVTGQISLDAEGLAGYFTTWQVSALGLGRLSSAATEGGSVTRLSGSARTSPVRELGLGGLVTTQHQWYAGRATRDAAGTAVAPTLHVVSLRAGADVDYNPLAGLFVLASVGAGVDLSADPSYEQWFVEARVGVEYSF